MAGASSEEVGRNSNENRACGHKSIVLPLDPNKPLKTGEPERVIFAGTQAELGFASGLRITG